MAEGEDEKELILSLMRELRIVRLERDAAEQRCASLATTLLEERRRARRAAKLGREWVVDLTRQERT